jgi:hypothetical protein
MVLKAIKTVRNGIFAKFGGSILAIIGIEAAVLYLPAFQIIRICCRIQRRFGGSMKTESGLPSHFELGVLCRTAMIGLALLAASCAGCTGFNHTSATCCSDQVFGVWRDNVWAQRAYCSRFSTCPDPHPRHFRSGFLAGYQSVCCGEDGYVPAVPPKSYWGYSYQNAQGSQMAGSWFAGYPEGVRAAQEDGAGNFRNVQVSAMLNAALQPQTSEIPPQETIEVIDSNSPPVLSGRDLSMPPASNNQAQPDTSATPPLPSGSTTQSLRRTGSISTANAPLADQTQPISWNLKQ